MDRKEETESLISNIPIKESEIVGVGQKMKGMTALVFCLFFLVTSATNVQLLQQRISDFALNSLTCGSAFLISTCSLVATRQWPVIAREEWISTSLYSLNNFVWPVTLYIDVRLLPTATVESIIQASNITFGIVLFYFFLGEKPTLFVLLSSVLCISGIISVIQPDFIFNLGNQNKIQDIGGINGTNGTSGVEVNEGEAENIAQVVFKYLIAVVSGLTYCADIVILKKRPYLNDHMTAVLFWSFLSNTVLSVIIMLIFERPCIPTGSYDILNIVLHCLCFAILWPFYMYAVKYISGNTCNIIFSMNVVLMLIAQYTILSSVLPGKRNWIEVLGVVLVLSGSTLTSVMEVCQQFSSRYN